MDYPILNFQRTYGRKDNNSFIGNTKVHTYTADSCTANGIVCTRSSYQEALVPDMGTPVPQNFKKHLIMVASNIMYVSE